MQIALIQCALVWENPTENRKYFENKIKDIKDDVDLIILPEMFTSGFTMNPELVAESMDGTTICAVKSWAKSKNCAITGSLVIKENGSFYNRMIFVFPDGTTEYYDKKHLFSLAGENNKYTAGVSKKIISFKDFKICLQICYDLRFPVFSRNFEDYDLLIYCANWPEIRVNAWNILLKARAVENMCFVVGVNRIGTDNNNLSYTGQSQIVDFMGNYLIEPQTNEGVFITTIEKAGMADTREKLGFLRDRDNLKLN